MTEPAKPIVLFDFDGTLCHTEPAIVFSIAQTFAHHGLPLPDPAHVRQLIGSGVGLTSVLLALRSNAERDFDLDEQTRWADLYRTIYRDQGEALVTLFEEVRDTLEILHGRARLAIASNKSQAAIVHSLNTFGLSKCFEHVFGTEAHLPKKPDPRLFTEVIAPTMGITNKSHCVLIGDTTADLLFAANVGVNAIYAQYGYGDDIDCAAIGYHRVLKRFGELQDWL